MKNSVKKFVKTVSDNRGVIIRRTIIIGGSVVAVALTAGLLNKRIAADELPFEVAEAIADATK